jgi:hypothetical protein
MGIWLKRESAVITNLQQKEDKIKKLEKSKPDSETK